MRLEKTIRSSGKGQNYNYIEAHINKNVAKQGHSPYTWSLLSLDRTLDSDDALTQINFLLRIRALLACCLLLLHALKVSGGAWCVRVR